MTCQYHTARPTIRLTEEMILNDKALPVYMRTTPAAGLGWRRYRIEYGFECSCPEGLIYLPPGVDVDEVETMLNRGVDPLRCMNCGGRHTLEEECL